MKPSVEKEDLRSPAALTLLMAVKQNGLKNKWLSAQATLVIGFVLQAGMAAAQNLVTNPGFETGDTTGWFAFGPPTILVETSQVRSGIYACLVTNRTATWNGIAQSFVGDLEAGQTYNVSAWVRLVSGGNQTMQLTMQKADGSGTSYAAIASGSVSSSGWSQLSGQYAYNPSGTVSALNFYAEVPSSSTASFYIDDVQLSGVTIVTNPPINGVCAVDWNDVHQRIDGFGASSAWRSSLTTAQADMFFSTNTGIGLSLLRNHITATNTTSSTGTPTTSEWSIMQMAQARGAKVWSTPWTPPNGFKDCGTANGGNYLGRGANATNLAYASQLANYVLSMKNTYGVNLYAVSVQNESDYNTTNWESCVWTGQQIHDFVTNLYNALIAKGVGSIKIIIPESMNWSSNPGLYLPSLTDTNVAPDVSVIANHNYVLDNDVGDTTTPAALTTYGKPVWETEVSTSSSYDGGISNAMYWAWRIHLFLTVPEASAWHYWWLMPLGSDNAGLTDSSGNPAKRMYVLGNYSRFVRPGCCRLSVNNNTNTLITAFKDSFSPGFAIVAVNTNASTDVNQTFNLTNFTTAAVTPWVTSASLSLASQPAITVTNSTFSFLLPAWSVVTFVGQASTNTPPTLAPIADRTINAGVTLVLTNTATDPDVPPETLTFSLLNGPTNATLTPLNNGTNAVFTWRPLVSQANSTNPVSVAVADNGSPGLKATNSFTVTVNALTNPLIGSVTVSAGRVNLSVSGPQGPDYTLLTSTNLLNWQPLFTTNPAAMPLSLTGTNLGDPARFYRLQLGP